MPNNTETVRCVVMQQLENVIIEAAELYRESDSHVSELSYYKALERMAKAGELVHLAKGMYYRPRKSRFGTVPISEKEIISYFTADNRGLIIGYRLYVNKGLTTQVSRKAEVLSVSVREQKKNVSNVVVSRIDMKLNPMIKKTVEAFEVLQNYNSIQDLNTSAFANYMNQFAEDYSDETAEYVIAHRKYKKSTIAFMKKCMDILGVPCGLGMYLSPLSEYKIPSVEEIHAAT